MDDLNGKFKDRTTPELMQYIKYHENAISEIEETLKVHRATKAEMETELERRVHDEYVKAHPELAANTKHAADEKLLREFVEAFARGDMSYNEAMYKAQGLLEAGDGRRRKDG